MPDFAVIIPAAGGSSRLGHPKQLVMLDGEPLVRRAARTALASGASQVIVVVGASASEVAEALRGLDVQIVENPNWQLGLGSTFRCGMDAIGRSLNAAVISLCDMPEVNSELLRELARSVATGDPPVAAAEYDCHLGPPAAFHHSEFAALRNLTGDQGARKIIESSPKVARIDFPGGVCDIDVPEDLARLRE